MNDNDLLLYIIYPILSTEEIDCPESSSDNDWSMSKCFYLY